MYLFKSWTIWWWNPFFRNFFLRFPMLFNFIWIDNHKIDLVLESELFGHKSHWLNVLTLIRKSREVHVITVPFWVFLDFVFYYRAWYSPLAYASSTKRILIIATLLITIVHVCAMLARFLRSLFGASICLLVNCTLFEYMWSLKPWLSQEICGWYIILRCGQ